MALDNTQAMPAEDWMSVSTLHRPRGLLTPLEAEAPAELWKLHAASERIRTQAASCSAWRHAIHDRRADLIIGGHGTRCDLQRMVVVQCGCSPGFGNNCWG